MINQQPKARRKGLDELYNSVGEDNMYKMAINDNCRALQRLLSNNRYLLSLEGRSLYWLLKRIYEQSGFKICQSHLRNISTGKNKTVNTSIIFVIARYWGRSWVEMCSVDYSKGEQLGKEG